MNNVQIARLLRRIAHTLETEIDCGECSQLSPQYVDAIVDGQDGMDGRWALVRAHVEQCSVCAQEIVTLREVVRMDLNERWPPLATLIDWACRGDVDFYNLQQR